MQSEHINELAEALALAQGQIKNPPCNQRVTVVTRSGGKYEFPYADFSAVIDAVKKPLSDNGISYIQYVEPVRDSAEERNYKFRLVTMLMHRSGQWVSAHNPLFLAPEKDRDGNVLQPSSQAFGSAVTYMKRYALAAMTGVSADTDDDANAADDNEAKITQKTPFAKPPTAAAIVTPTSTVEERDLAEPERVINEAISGQAWRRFSEKAVTHAKEGGTFSPEQQAKMSLMQKQAPAAYQKMKAQIADAQMKATPKEVKKPKEPEAAPVPVPHDDPDAYRLWFIDQLSQLETVDEVTLFTEEQSAQWKKCFPPDIEDWEALSKDRVKELGK